MFSIRSIGLIALTALAGLVVASPTGETTAASAASVPALAGILTTARTQLFAVQTEANYAILTGNVKDADAANAYVDKMADIVSNAQEAFDASRAQALLSGSANDDVVDSLKVVVADLIKLVDQVIEALLGSIPSGSREAVVSNTSATLE
ncbi:hypothetical protein H0H93_014013 [Arthromyces matolae]|nr:hypothetical protein H0H93_014013 [Arthromyces matolae]